MATLVHQLPSILNKMLGSETAKPRVIMTDRGPSLYHGSQGTIVGAYREALTSQGFRPFAGDDGKWQPPDLADLFMHETVAAWVRKYFRKHPVSKISDLKTNRAAVAEGLRACEKHINKEYEVAALCASMPRRVEELLRKRGDRLKY